MHTTQKFNLLFAGILFCTTTYADNISSSQFVKSSVFIPNLNQTLAAVKKTTNLPVIFPALIPKDPAHNQYYASYDKDNTGPGKGYLINVDYTADCNGVHVCNVGYLHAEPGKKPENFYDRNNKNITETVTLTHHIRGYYTAGHAMGSYFPPVMQWRTKDILYTLSWDDHVADKAAFIAMVNSGHKGLY